MTNDTVIGFVVGGVAGFVAVLVFIALRIPPPCPECGEQLPRFRRPVDVRQALRGGWTCRHCGCQVDRHGKPVDSSP